MTGMAIISGISVVGTWVGMASLSGREPVARSSRLGVLGQWICCFSRGPIAIGVFMILARVLSSHPSAYAALQSNSAGTLFLTPIVIFELTPTFTQLGEALFQERVNRTLQQAL